MKVDKKALAKEQKKAALEEARKKALEVKVRVRNFLDHYYTIAFMTFLTIYALIFDDIRVMNFSKETDDVFFGCTAAALIIFLIEMGLSCYA